jgi:predicted dehydrogenase
MTDVARIGVVGCGWWSTFAHLPALRRNPRAEIVGLADPNHRNRAAAAAEFGVSTECDSVEELLERTAPDGVVVAVPPALHYGCARAALSEGAHVLLEKPMVLDVHDGRALVDLARRQGRELLMSYPWQYNRQAAELRDLLAGGAIGEIEHITCLFASVVRELYRGNPEPYRDVLQYVVNAPTPSTYSDPTVSGGGQGHNQLTHAVALLLWLTGLVPERLSAFTESCVLPVDRAGSV